VVVPQKMAVGPKIKEVIFILFCLALLVHLEYSISKG
jgi:hypothetical protein